MPSEIFMMILAGVVVFDTAAILFIVHLFSKMVAPKPSEPEPPKDTLLEKWRNPGVRLTMPAELQPFPEDE